MNLVECKDVCKSNGNKQVLDPDSFTIEPAKIIGLLGPNGSGKSTIIKMINQLLTPDSGEILVNDKPLGIESKKVISYLPERSYLNFNVKVIELMDFFEDFYEDFDRKTAESLIEKLKINPKDKLKTMSKGTKEKVQLIMVMSRKADLYILDEPIGGVDPAARDYILTTILSNFNEGASILISTHLIADVEKILDEVIFISEGKVLLQQSADELRNEKQQSIDGVFREVFKC